MIILGWILMVVGSFWCIGRIQNQGDMYRSFLRVSSEKGVFFGIQRYITTEFILGFGMGTFLLSLGYFLVYDFIPFKLSFGLLTCLFYVLSCNIGYINITEGITRRTDLSMIEIKYPFLSSIIPLGHPIFLIILYVCLGILTFNI
jgi:hypothetical protein